MAPSKGKQMKRLTWLPLLLKLVQVLTACGKQSNALVLSRSDYQDRLRVFWLSESIANWTGLQTEGARTRILYYTHDDWDRFGFTLNQGLWSADFGDISDVPHHRSGGIQIRGADQQYASPSAFGRDRPHHVLVDVPRDHCAQRRGIGDRIVSDNVDVASLSDQIAGRVRSVDFF